MPAAVLSELFVNATAADQQYLGSVSNLDRQAHMSHSCKFAEHLVFRQQPEPLIDTVWLRGCQQDYVVQYCGHIVLLAILQLRWVYSFVMQSCVTV